MRLPCPDIFCLLLACACATTVLAQEGSTSVYDFLRLPTSAHASALGGAGIALPDDDASLFLQNPSLLSNVSDRSLAVSYMSYMQGCHAGSAAWAQAAGARGTWGVGVHYVGYGSMAETFADGSVTGTFSAADMAVAGSYAYTLSEHVAGGVTGKVLYSHYGAYSSVALAVDLGLNYYDPERELSVSLVAANIGGQVKTFADSHEALPFDLRAGFTKRLEGAPFRFSVTMTDLTRWRAADFYSPEGKMHAGRLLTNHIVLGADVLFSDSFHASVGYNLRRAYELQAAGAAHGAGLTIGAGLSLKRFQVSVAYAKYHVSASSLMLTVQVSL